MRGNTGLDPGGHEEVWNEGRNEVLNDDMANWQWSRGLCQGPEKWQVLQVPVLLKRETCTHVGVELQVLACMGTHHVTSHTRESLTSPELVDISVPEVQKGIQRRRITAVPTKMIMPSCHRIQTRRTRRNQMQNIPHDTG
jgi:hypothetical protein